MTNVGYGVNSPSPHRLSSFRASVRRCIPSRRAAVAMGQSISCRVTVSDTNVHPIVDLPGFLGLFAGKIRDVIQQEAPKLLK